MKSFTQLIAIATLTALAAAQSSTSVASSAAAGPTEVTDCHMHEDTPYCFAGEDEWQVEDVVEADLADAYTDCVLEGPGELHCDSPEVVHLAAAAATTTTSDEEDQDHAEEATSTSTAEGSAAAAAVTEVTGCHLHDETPYCYAGEDEWELQTAVDTDALPDAYTECDLHGADELHCASPEDVTLLAAAATSESEEDHSESSSSSGAAESQTEEDAASTMQISGAAVMVGAAVIALCVF